MRRAEQATATPAMMAGWVGAATPALSSDTSISLMTLISGALLRAGVVVSLIISGLLLLTRPAVSLVEGAAGLASSDTHATLGGYEER